MERKILDEIICTEIKKYSDSKKELLHCLLKYELICEDLIQNIRLSSFEKSHKFFAELIEIQDFLSNLTYRHNYDIGKKLHRITFNIDRLDDLESKRKWYDRFCGGMSWPD